MIGTLAEMAELKAHVRSLPKQEEQATRAYINHITGRATNTLNLAEFEKEQRHVNSHLANENFDLYVKRSHGDISMHKTAAPIVAKYEFDSIVKKAQDPLAPQRYA